MVCQPGDGIMGLLAIMSPLPMKCRTDPTPGIWVHLSGACGSQLQGLLHRLGDTTVMVMSFISAPSIDEDVCTSGVVQGSGEAMALISLH